MTSSILSLIWIRNIRHLGQGCYSVEMLPYFFSKTLVSMENDQLFLEKNEAFLTLAIFPIASNENWLELIRTTPPHRKLPRKPPLIGVARIFQTGGGHTVLKWRYSFVWTFSSWNGMVLSPPLLGYFVKKGLQKEGHRHARTPWLRPCPHQPRPLLTKNISILTLRVLKPYLL